MPAQNAIETTHQIELIIGQLDSLSILPCTAQRLFAGMANTQQASAELLDIIETDPCLAIMLFSTAYQHSISPEPTGTRPDKATLDHIRDILFNTEVATNDSAQNNHIQKLREELVTHSIAVGCCARKIAEVCSTNVNPYSAYFAGLLHDIGKLALQQLMPKSFERIADEAKTTNTAIHTAERKYLGLDHTVLGKRLAVKWQLPSEIAMAIWLHHSQVTTISQNVPEAEIAQVVQLADLIVHQSANHNPPESLQESATKLAKSIGLNHEQIQQLSGELEQKVNQKCQILGLDKQNSLTAYCKVARDTALRLFKENYDLTNKNQKLQTAAGHIDFIADFLSTITASTSPMKAAGEFIVRWQKFYQTGKICLCLPDKNGQKLIEVVLIDDEPVMKTILIEKPQDKSLIPAAVMNDFAIINADETVDWLFEQLGVEFTAETTKLLPVISAGGTIAMIVFEWPMPVEISEISDDISKTIHIIGAVLDSLIEYHRQQYFAELFVQLIGKANGSDYTNDAPPHSDTTDSNAKNKKELFEALVEMAAGAAHELNNPLGIITGRTQLLSSTEDDAQKKRVLSLIEDNAYQASQITDELMGFAAPPIPHASTITVRQIIDEAVELAKTKTNRTELDVTTMINDADVEIFVDSAQIATAVSNIICNAVESYSDNPGQVEIKVENKPQTNTVKIEITDFGCGMDEQIVRKATYPFYSAKTAGRSRGMGLAYAQRFIEINKGTLAIDSQPSSGTTVTISVPQKNT